jgi:hypothetical protein
MRVLNVPVTLACLYQYLELRFDFCRIHRYGTGTLYGTVRTGIFKKKITHRIPVPWYLVHQYGLTYVVNLLTKPMVRLMTCLFVLVTTNLFRTSAETGTMTTHV